MESTMAPAKDQPVLEDAMPTPKILLLRLEASAKQIVLTTNDIKPKVRIEIGKVKICIIGLIEILISAIKSAKLPYDNH